MPGPHPTPALARTALAAIVAPMASAARTTISGLALLLAISACDSKANGPSAAASASAAAPASATAKAESKPSGLDAESVAKVVNPKGQPAYDGPVGTLKGVIRIDGDPAPSSDLTFPAECAEGAATYGKLFRVGQDKALADALVAVTGYDAYVPAREEAEKLTLRGCAYKSRTLGLTFGQHIELSNLDPKQSFMPFLDGGRYAAIMVATPKGAPVKVYAQKPGHYMLRDMLDHKFMVSDVYVLAYPTHAVTDLDGQYAIAGIPVGKVKVNAFLPVLNKTVGQEIEIHEGDNTLDLTLHFDAAKDIAALQKTPPPAGSAPAVH